MIDEEVVKEYMIEYLKTGHPCYKKVIDYLDGNNKGCLNLCETPISKLPKNLTVNGYLDLSYSGIIELGEGLTVFGNLDISNTKIDKLPKGMHVHGHLIISRTEVDYIPTDLYVSKYLYLPNTPIANKYDKRVLKKMLRNVKGEIYTKSVRNF